MESAAKRKAASAAGGDGEGRPAKRQKVPAESNANSETVESTTISGLKFLDSLKAAKDKTGRPIADHFLSLPDKDELPEYYEHVKLPIALETIENKLNAGEYSNLAQVESDCKRLVNNAKSYNEKKSAVYEDAERLRKTASNWMTKNNPAYRDGNYVAVATPIPGEDSSTPSKPLRTASTPRAAQTPSTGADTAERPRRAAAVAAAQLATPAPSKLRHSASAARLSGKDSTGFSGKTFQQAQEQIVSHIIDYEDGGVQIFLPFLNLPPRSLKDYYALIREPMSLSAVQKKVRGVVGREAPTGQTLYKSWDAFEKSFSMIWSNARIYNEDGSDIYTLSQELEDVFFEKLNDAKANVIEPSQPKLRLNMSGGAAVPKQQLKLKLRQSPGSEANTPGARSSTTPGVIVDGDALQRQQRHVLDATHRPSRPSSSGKTVTVSAVANPFNGPRGGSSSIPSLPLGHPRASGSPALNEIKQDTQSPALSAVRPTSTAPDGQRLSVPMQAPAAVMAPPSTTPRPTSGSPHPNGVSQTNGYHTPYQAQTYYAPPAAPRFDCLRKIPLKSIDDALIPKIILNTHPALNLAKPWSAAIYADKQKTAHSATIVVSSTHSYLQITPNVPIALTSRLYRLFVTVNGNRTLEVNRVPVTAGINGSSPGPGYESGKKKGEPVFEAKLIGGVNRIEVEIVAEKERKDVSDAGNAKDQIEIEKCTIFLHLMRQPSY
ncbi:hypothetical protein ACN47E_003136 [Coniothyrium glycines]